MRAFINHYSRSGAGYALTVVILVLALLPSTPSNIRAEPDENLARETLDEVATCPVCGRDHTAALFTVDYKGRTFHLCSGDCLDAYHRLSSLGRLDSITQNFEPRAALFQADSAPRPTPQKLHFLLGIYVLAGVLFGGACAYSAIQKGRSGARAFTLGMLLNVIGYVIVLTWRSRSLNFKSKGLRKVPTTHDEAICPMCRGGNHPSALACTACGGTLIPSVQSEVDIIRPDIS